MSRVVETKFWIGDTVWAALRKCESVVRCDSCGHESYQHRFVTERISINHIEAQLGYPIFYSEYPGGDGFAAHELFATEAEAKAECDRRNKELEK